MKTTSAILAPPPGSRDADQREIVTVLAPLWERAKNSSSLMASRATVQIEQSEFELPKFLLLGQRGGGKPIRLALFGGLDAGRVESTAALVRGLTQFERNLSQARDFALFGYPMANVRGFAPRPEPFSEFERRFVASQADGDLAYFQKEARQWNFDGMISYRLDPKASGFYATVRSELLGAEMVAPALESLARLFPVASDKVIFLPASKISAPMTFLPSPGVLANPFEVEIFAPGRAALEQRIAGLAAFLPEILRNYRRFISYAANL